jgi:hypothetical protein
VKGNTIILPEHNVLLRHVVTVDYVPGI